MDLEYLQKKYPEFVYESARWRLEGGDFMAAFKFIMGEIEFNPEIVIRGIDEKRVESLGPAAVANLVFHMGLAEIPSYWKAACPPRIIVRAGYLARTQADFWQDLIFNMGQFFFENNLPFLKPKFEIAAIKPKDPGLVKAAADDEFLVSLGGGKDSLVALEVLRRAKKRVKTFTLGGGVPLGAVAAAAKTKNFLVERRIDKKLIELNKKGYLNGHTPFSSILAVLGVALAAMDGCRDSVISQERSSDEGNVEYLGRTVNHQYSKSYAFEEKFRAYSQKYLAKNIRHYSLLRPLYEIQIMRIFAGLPEYFQVFLSCNKAYTIAMREKNASAGWCGACSKCLSTFAMAYPFIGHEETIGIFGKNLFEDPALRPVMMELLGLGSGPQFKPFECVGTAKETLAAFYLSFKSAPDPKPVLLDYFAKNILPKHSDLESQSKKIMLSWNGRHNVPRDLAELLKQTAGV